MLNLPSKLYSSASFAGVCALSESEEDKPAESSAPDPHTAAEFLVEVPLYTEFKPSGAFLKKLRHTGFRFDSYCVECAKESTFSTAELSIKRVPPSISGGFEKPSWLTAGAFSIRATCGRVGSHIYIGFFLMKPDGTLRKVGQHPSRADIASADLRKYRSVLKNEWLRELNAATGLASHGVGIGSFVYLRRIFEGLIQDHYTAFTKDHGEIEGFVPMRMNEKVKALAAVLPPLLVEHSASYAILSKGIHELDEQTCLEFFPVIRRSIILILDQDLRMRSAAQEAEALKVELQKIAGRLG